MKTSIYFLSFTFLSLNSSCQTDELFCGDVNRGSNVEVVSKIGFGSCANQNQKQPVLDKITERKPDVFCWLGDNIYGDTENMKTLTRKYSKLGCKEEFRALNKASHFLAVWDDHDYGENDAGKEYPKKEESKDIFLDFWSEQQTSERWNHAGIYHSETFGPEGKRVQFIMLDTRTFRDPLLKADGPEWKHDYKPNYDSSATFLGLDQWAWLETVLQEPAELRVVMSSNQFGITYNGYEAWANVPAERQRMINLIGTTRANGVIFISGDVHWAEISKQEVENGYPLYDITSSGITQEWNSTEPNDNRIGEPFRSNNAGMIEVDWEQEDPLLRFNIIDVYGTEVRKHEVRLSELQF
ncbi:MAG: alkaline phosphatase D [Bacteroidia bacterium]|jgi:alkaline phosphatase D